MNSTRILLAEDDDNLGFVLEESLQREGYEVVRCVDGAAARMAFGDGHFDLCLLDVMMPVKDGFTLAKEIREEGSNTPIIFLTARSLKEDRIEGFRLGGDDYMTKPFSMEELLLRIQAVLRRAGISGGGEEQRTTFDIGSYSFDHSRRELTFGEPAPAGGEGPAPDPPRSTRKLTDKEADLLMILCAHMNRMLDRQVALGRVWGEQGYFTSRSMDVYISKLRKYLADDPRIEIVNVRGKGFKLVLRED